MRWHERNNKWEARIFDGQRQVSLGYYNTEVEAAVAFDAAALQLRGPATCTNFVPPAGAGEPSHNWYLAPTISGSTPDLLASVL